MGRILGGDALNGGGDSQKMAFVHRVRLTLLLAGLAFTSCGEDGSDCLMPPCPLSLAVRVRVLDATTRGLVVTSTLRVSGATTTSRACAGECSVMGTAGTYILEVSAPGYETARNTVTVTGVNPECGCPTTSPETVEIALVPAAQGAAASPTQ